MAKSMNHKFRAGDPSYPCEVCGRPRRDAWHKVEVQASEMQDDDSAAQAAAQQGDAQIQTDDATHEQAAAITAPSVSPEHSDEETI